MDKEIVMKVLEMALSDKRGTGVDVSGYERYKDKNVFIRTVTHHYTGNVISVDALSLTLKDAAWIADDGRFNESLKDPSKFEEVEPYTNHVTISLYAICDITTVPRLITEVK